MFVFAEYSVLHKMGTKKSQQAVRTALSAHLLRGGNLLLGHISHHVFVNLRRCLSYINAGAYLYLVLGAFYRADDAPAGKDSSNIANESRHVMKRNTPAVWEAILYLNSVRFVDKCRTAEQRVSISYKTSMRAALAAQSVFHAQKTQIQG